MVISTITTYYLFTVAVHSYKDQKGHKSDLVYLLLIYKQEITQTKHEDKHHRYLFHFKDDCNIL